MEVEGERIVTKEKAIEVLQKERDLIAGERELDESQFATELLEALNVGIDAIMEQIGVTIHINIRDADKEKVMKMFDKYGLIERILYGKKTEEKGSVTCVNQEKAHDKPTETSWIPCSERLPEEDGRYLVTCSAIGAWKVDWNIWYNDSKSWLHKLGVTAWMPMPDPYQRGEQE